MAEDSQLSIEHYLQILLHRKWVVIVTFLAVSAGTIMFSSRLPDVFTSETVILVDPQKVPDSYVRTTVTGDIRNRLGTLSQQILSATRLQRIIDTFNLYPEQRKSAAREEVIATMRSNISVRVLSDFANANQDLQAFKITYSGSDPRVVAQVTNQLASLFIEENLKAREQQATGTTEFLKNQLEETRKVLEEQENSLKQFKMRHIGELPEQEAATLQILGQLQSQLQMEADALNRAEQQETYIQSLMTVQPAPVVEVDDFEPRMERSGQEKPSAQASSLAAAKAQLAALLTRLTEEHPDVIKLRREIEDAEAKQLAATVDHAPPPPAPSRTARVPRVPATSANPVLQTQLKAAQAEIAKRREEYQRLSKQVALYRAKVGAIPMREQELTKLVRNYEMSKAHYQQLLEKQLAAETATQLEIRQKGEKFSVLDPAQVPEKPSAPNRVLINSAGAALGLALGLLLATVTEFLGISITSAKQVVAVTNLPVLEVIPIIQTAADRIAWKRRMFMAGGAAVILASFVAFFSLGTTGLSDLLRRMAN